MIITTAEDSKPAFKPVSFTVTLESQAEVDALFQVGNWSGAVEEMMLTTKAFKLPYHKVLVTFWKYLGKYASK